MNLRNKKTGGKGYLYANKDANYNVLDADDKVLAVYPSLAELSEDWEDYEEPKKYWYIDSCGGVLQEYFDGGCIDIQRKQIGNYFKTEEDAEKAVERLKAWERLQKKFDLHIAGWDVLDNQVIITTDCDFDYVRDRQDDGLWADLDLLFNGNLIIGGEE